MKRDSMIFYRSFYSALSRLGDADRLAAYDALIGYGLDGLDGADGVAAAILEAFRPLIDANNRKYENGKKGGRPKAETTAKPNGNQTETTAEPEPNLNDKCKKINVKSKDNSARAKWKPKNERSYDYSVLEAQLLSTGGVT